MISLKKITTIVFATLIIAGSVIGYQQLTKDSINADNSKDLNHNIVSVNGKGVVTAEPNIAHINLSVKTKGKDIKTVQDKNAYAMEKVIKSLKDLDINTEDIQTADYSIHEDYDWIDDRDVFLGYIVKNSITVKVKNISKIGTVLDKAVSAGANVAGGISFDIDDKDKLYNKALKLAMKSSKSKANAIMETFDESADKPYRVLESNVYTSNYKSELMNEVKMGKEAVHNSDYSESIQGGSLIIVANVNVEYKY